MKSFSIILVFGFYFAISSTQANNFTSSTKAKEINAFAECNATNPVSKNPYAEITNGISAGDTRFLNLTKEEQCNLYCLLEKLKFFDENGNMNIRGITEFTSKLPGMNNYVDVIISQVYLIERSTKGVSDKCLRAFFSFLRYADALFALAVAQALEKTASIKKNVLSGAPVNDQLSEKIQEYLQIMNSAFEKRYSN